MKLISLRKYAAINQNNSPVGTIIVLVFKPFKQLQNNV
ncbi:hypothetical protein ACINWC323_1981 [Acinetobacter sp. WC-323]|nr:hypothetical protein ACINWC323_1981 [Acinetobacter sp. WC-323]